MLHDGEADEEDDEDETAGKRRLHHVVDEMAGDREPGRERPHQKQHPGRDQHDGAVEAVGGEIDDQREAEDGGDAERQAGDAGGNRGLDDRDAEEDGEADQPADGEVAVADVPAIEMQVGIGEDQKRRGEEDLGAGTPDLVGAGIDVDDLVPEAEVDAEIDENRPRQAPRSPGTSPCP